MKTWIIRTRDPLSVKWALWGVGILYCTSCKYDRPIRPEILFFFFFSHSRWGWEGRDDRNEAILARNVLCIACVCSLPGRCAVWWEKKGNRMYGLPPVVSPRVAEQGARIWEVLRGIILTLRLGDTAGFSSSHNSGALLSSMYTVRFQQCWKRGQKTKTALYALIEKTSSRRFVRYSCSDLRCVRTTYLSSLAN